MSKNKRALIKNKVKGFGWSPDMPSIKDYKFSAHPRAGDVLPEVSEDRRDINAPVIDQGDLGSCVGCSAVYGVAWLRRNDRDKYSTVYSALQAYFDARVADGIDWQRIDSGAYIRDAMDCLRKIGIAPESRWPYRPAKFANKPPRTVYSEAARWKLGAHWRCDTIEDIMRAINAGFAVVGGISCYSSMFSDHTESTGLIPMPGKRDILEGGHALYFDMYSQKERVLRFQNSWGKGWGDNGYGFLPFAYASDRNLSDDFWAMECEAPETTPWKDD